LKKQLFGLQMMEEVDFNQHLDKFNKITTDLASLEVKIEVEDKALILSASLPSSFDNIMTTPLFGKETLRLDEVVAAFLMNETRRGNNELSNNSQVAMVTKESSLRRGWSREKEEWSQRSRSNGQKFKCY